MFITVVYILPFVVITLLMWGLSLYIWQRRYVPGAIPFVLLMASAGLWSFFYIFELLSKDLATALVVINLELIGITAAPLLWFVFVAAYTQHTHWLSRRNLIVLAMIGIVDLVLSWTSPIHHLIRNEVEASRFGELMIVKFTYGPLFWVFTAFDYSLLFISTIILLVEIHKKKYTDRMQRILLVVALAVPWVANIFYVTSTNSLRNFDITSIGFGITGVVVVLGILRYHMLGLVPIARYKIMDFMDQAVLVLDPADRIIEINPWAQRLIGMADQVINRSIRDIDLHGHSQILKALIDVGDEDVHKVYTLDDNHGDKRSYELTISAVKDRAGLFIGRLLVLSDITTHKQIEDMLRQNNEELERRVSERTAELRASEERYALAARGANDGIWDWDLVNNQVYYSPRWKEMFGYEENELGDSLDAWFVRIHPDDYERVKASLDAHMNEGRVDYLSEHRLRRKNGSYCWVLVRGQVIYDADGKPTRMAGSFSDISRHKQFEEQLLRDALYDMLTNLPNRALLTDRLTHTCQRISRNPEMKYALLYIDLDNFKAVNDRLGHTYGDFVLIECAKRLSGCVRAMDTIARLGGDEFVILIEEIQDNQDVVQVLERIYSGLTAPIVLDDHTVFITASIGVRLPIIDSDTPEDILRDADIAMYHAKLSGKARNIFFDVTMRDNAVTRMEIEDEMRIALKQDRDFEGFFLHYQPIVSLQSGRVIGFEALARWRHPQRGLISPGIFIPIAEESGLIFEIGQWVLREACRRAQDWNNAFPSETLRTISVNLSARQITRRDLVDQVVAVLRDTKLPPECLKLEITESMLIDDPQVVGEILEQLRQLRVQVQIDDFGTGYSSLSYLHRLPIDALKIDRSFISRIDHTSERNSALEVVRMILALARELGIKVVAEGVESRNQYNLLKDLNCDYVQGFLISQPLEPSAVEVFLEAVRF